MWNTFLRAGDLVSIELDFTCDMFLVIDIDRADDTVVLLNARLGRKETFYGEWLGSLPGTILQSRPDAM